MSHARDLSRLILVALSAIAFGGCSGLQRDYNYWNPGDARRQKSIAIAHDPYPLNDVGPPIAGGRPQGFEKPLSEVQRAQLYNPPHRALQPLPTLQPTVVSPPTGLPVAAPPPAAWPAPPPVQTVPAPYSSAPPAYQIAPAPQR